MVSVLLQLLGALAALVGGTWAMGPWFLLFAGLVLVVAPELLSRPRPGRTDEVSTRRKEREAS